MIVLAFDRDWTVDVNPHPRREAVPLEWVRYWAHETDHEVWAIGNQDLVEEADIPGTVESIRRRDGDIEALGERDEYGYYEWWPEREHRLRILADLFPEAEQYVVVDDLDLTHVEGWEHYHAWDFVDAVRSGEIDLSTPGSAEASTDGGFDSKEAVGSVLDEGVLFELTHRTDDGERIHLVRHFEPERPSMYPLEGPPAFWFEPLGGDDRFSVRLPDVVDVQPVPFEQIPDPLCGKALESLLKSARDDPVAITRYVDDLTELASTESQHRALATQCLMEVADDDPTAAVDAVPVLATVVSEDEGQARSFAVYGLARIADEYPEQVYPAVDTLIETIGIDDDQTWTNALSAIGHVTSAYPDAAAPIAGDLADYLGDDNKRVRNNAVGLLGDIAQHHSDVVIEHADAIAARLEDTNVQARVNASIALLAAGEADPAAIRAQTDRLTEALTDASPQVRANACTLIGNAEASVDLERLRDLEENDPNERVREQAEWAIHQCSE